MSWYGAVDRAAVDAVGVVGLHGDDHRSADETCLAESAQALCKRGRQKIH